MQQTSKVNMNDQMDTQLRFMALELAIKDSRAPNTLDAAQAFYNFLTYVKEPEVVVAPPAPSPIVVPTSVVTPLFPINRD